MKEGSSWRAAISWRATICGISNGMGAGGGSHLRVRKTGQILLAEVDQAPLALQEGQEVERLRGIHGGGTVCERGAIACGKGAVGAEGCDARRKARVEDDAEPADDREPQAREE